SLSPYPTLFRSPPASSVSMPPRFTASASNTAYEIPDEAENPSFPGVLGADDRRPAGVVAGPGQRDADGEKPGNADQGQFRHHRGQPATAPGSGQPPADSPQGKPRQRGAGPVARSVPDRPGQRHRRVSERGGSAGFPDHRQCLRGIPQ